MTHSIPTHKRLRPEMKTISHEAKVVREHHNPAQVETPPKCSTFRYLGRVCLDPPSFRSRGAGLLCTTALAQLKKPGHEPATWDRDELLATLTRPSLLNIYFPASLDEKPFCFCEVWQATCALCRKIVAYRAVATAVRGVRR